MWPCHSLNGVPSFKGDPIRTPGHERTNPRPAATTARPGPCHRWACSLAVWCCCLRRCGWLGGDAKPGRTSPVFAILISIVVLNDKNLSLILYFFHKNLLNSGDIPAILNVSNLLTIVGFTVLYDRHCGTSFLCTGRSWGRDRLVLF